MEVLNQQKLQGKIIYDSKGNIECIYVMGVAKTFFKDSSSYLEVYRGNSNKPLYVSAVGLDLNYSAQFVKELKSEYRMPEMLKRVDKLSREPYVEDA